MLESARDLKQSLRSLSSDLLVTVGAPEDVISVIARGSSSCSVLCATEATSEELAIDAKVGYPHVHGPLHASRWGEGGYMPRPVAPSASPLQCQ